MVTHTKSQINLHLEFWMPYTQTSIILHFNMSNIRPRWVWIWPVWIKGMLEVGLIQWHDLRSKPQTQADTGWSPLWCEQSGFHGAFSARSIWECTTKRQTSSHPLSRGRHICWVQGEFMMVPEIWTWLIWPMCWMKSRRWTLPHNNGHLYHWMRCKGSARHRCFALLCKIECQIYLVAGKFVFPASFDRYSTGLNPGSPLPH